jgi:hypothetical protein
MRGKDVDALHLVTLYSYTLAAASCVARPIGVRNDVRDVSVVVALFEAAIFEWLVLYLDNAAFGVVV